MELVPAESMDSCSDGPAIILNGSFITVACNNEVSGSTGEVDVTFQEGERSHLITSSAAHARGIQKVADSGMCVGS